MKLDKILIAFTLIVPVADALACASCGCSLNSDLGIQGVSSNPGWTFDLRYDYLNQDQLRSGTKTISPAVAATTFNAKVPTQLAEVEGFTKNNYLTSSLDYTNGETSGVTFILPFIQREHMTFGSADTNSNQGGWPTGANGYTSQTSGFGDIKIIGRYFGFSEQKNWGLQFGIKLPSGNTGQFGVPTTAGQPAAVDPGLQLGTGSTDFIAGAYRFGHIQGTENWGYFGNLQFQAAVDPKTTPAKMGSGTYRPGNGLNINGGLNYQGFEDFVPTVQLNFVDKRSDSGSAADTWSTGGTLVYITPGLLYTTTDATQFYANIQVPLYQNLNGIQLAPKFVGSIGVRLHF